MKKYLLPNDGTFYKASLHTHTTVSDGRMTPEELKEHYKENGYSVVAFTDHDVLVPHPELADESFIPLNGYEMEIMEEGKERRIKKSCHMCFVAIEPDNLTQVCFHRSKYVEGNALNYLDKIKYDESLPDYERIHNHETISDAMKQGRENGFFVTFNHPTWSLEYYEDYMGYDNMHSMEVYNHECYRLGYNEFNEKEYDDMLRSGKRIYCIATDDCHSKDSCCGGFTMIKAEKFEYTAITKALLDGNFYASTGPQIFDLWVEDGKLYINCSDAENIALHTAARRAKRLIADDGKVLNSACFDVLPEDVYVRITVTDHKGKCAYTNAYFTDEIL